MLEATIISIHRHPRPLVRAFTRFAVAMGLSAALLVFLLQIVMAFTVGSLFIGTAIFTVLLTIPLMLLSVLHPEVTITTTGVRLRPLLWQAQTVPWNMLSTLTDHPLIYEDPVINRHLYGKRHRGREGKVIVMCRDAHVMWQYRLLGLVSGAGWTPAFGISSTTHTDYDQLLQTLMSRLEAQNS